MFRGLQSRILHVPSTQSHLHRVKWLTNGAEHNCVKWEIERDWIVFNHPINLNKQYMYIYPISIVNSYHFWNLNHKIGSPDIPKLGKLLYIFALISRPFPSIVLRSSPVLVLIDDVARTVTASIPNSGNGMRWDGMGRKEKERDRGTRVRREARRRESKLAYILL